MTPINHAPWAGDPAKTALPDPRPWFTASQLPQSPRMRDDMPHNIADLKADLAAAHDNAEGWRNIAIQLAAQMQAMRKTGHPPRPNEVN